jgi:formylglycine-generating enzyme required for sulfatase activity
MIMQIALSAVLLLVLPVVAQNEKVQQVVRLPTGFATEMALVPAGSYPRGAEGEAFDEQPVRQIHLDAYLIDKYEVTVAQWGEYQRVTGDVLAEWVLQNTVKRQNHPITLVTWDNATSFCQWADKRLPTEAEWERAARCDDGRKYPWGDGLDSYRANYFQSDDPFERGFGAILSTNPVGFFDGSDRDGYQTRDGSSPFGTYDMVGNVFEWTNDWYHPSYYTHGPDTNPQGPEKGVVKAVRGGSYAIDASHVRPTYRARDAPNFKGPDIGFRCAASVQAGTAVQLRSWGMVKRAPQALQGENGHE